MSVEHDFVTESLARFVAELDFDSIPPDVRVRAKTILIDAMACAVAGRDVVETPMIKRSVEAATGGGNVTVIAGGSLSLAGAVMINGYLTTAAGNCDIYRPAHCHVSPEVIPPALGVAEKERKSGRALVTAVAAGLEAVTRIGSALNYREFRARGWHSPGVIGPFGGAAACASLLGLSTAQTNYSFGLAGSQAAGTCAHFGTPTIKFHQSRGAFGGLMSALVAGEDFTAASDILTNPDGGLLNIFSDGDPSLVTRGLGTEWELENISLRRWPGAANLQTMITSLVDLSTKNSLDIDNVEEVRIGLSPMVYEINGVLDWDTELRRNLAAPYVAASVISKGEQWVSRLRASDDEFAVIDAFARDRVIVEPMDSLTGPAVDIRVRISGGEEFTDRRAVSKGDPGEPLTLDEVSQKFMEGTEGILSEPVSHQALETLIDIEAVDDVGELMRHFRIEKG